MAWIKRMHRVIGAGLHQALDHLEDPVAMLNYLVLEMCEHLELAREKVAAAMAAEKGLARRAADAVLTAQQWRERALRALEAGEETLAREALRRRRSADALAIFYARAQQTQATEVAHLRGLLEQLEQQLQQARMTREELLAQVDTARAQQTLAQTLRQTMGEQALEDFDRIARQIGAQQHRAQALVELRGPDGVDAFLVAEETLAIEQEISILRRELDYQAEETPRALEGDGRTS